jgi:hypothetical protein
MAVEMQPGGIDIYGGRYETSAAIYVRHSAIADREGDNRSLGSETAFRNWLRCLCWRATT